MGSRLVKRDFPIAPGSRATLPQFGKGSVADNSSGTLCVIVSSCLGSKTAGLYSRRRDGICSRNEKHTEARSENIAHHCRFLEKGTQTETQSPRRFTVHCHPRR